MAKKTQKTNQSTLLVKLTKYKKESAGVAVIIVLMVVAGWLFIASRQDPSTRPTAARELAKSTINAKNTKDTKPTAPTAADANPASGSSPTTSTSKPASTKPSTTTPASSGGGSSGGGSTPTSDPGSPAIAFEIESAPYGRVDDNFVDIGCNQSHRFTFLVDLTATAAGTATYHWERSDGARSPDRQAVFSGAGTQTVTNTWDLSSDGTPGSYEVTGWQQVIVTSPNELNSKASDADFTLSVNCI